MDMWKKNYIFTKAAEKGEMPLRRDVVLDKRRNEKMIGGGNTNPKLEQFLANDRKVLRFQGYWDDHTLYGMRMYFIMLYYLSDNTFEMNESHCRNSGRHNFPVFYKRGPLTKKPIVNCYPGMLEPDPDLYLPIDLLVGDFITVWGRKVVLYDCDEFTQRFYLEYMNIDQWASKLDVSEPQPTHKKLHPPPNAMGIG